MASSRVMASSSSPSHTASDLARFAAGKPGGGGSSGLGSMNVEELLRGIYADMPTPAAPSGVDRPMSLAAAPEVAARRTAEEVWKEITGGGGGGVVDPAAPAVVAATGGAGIGAEMTLEDFLAREGAMKEDDAMVAGPLAAAAEGQVVMGFLNGAEGAGGVSGGKSRRRQLMDPMDRAAMQRQKRMIKNRESAARSRERKQAYIAELESLVTQLEEENAQMLKEQAEAQNNGSVLSSRARAGGRAAATRRCRRPWRRVRQTAPQGSECRADAATDEASCGGGHGAAAAAAEAGRCGERGRCGEWVGSNTTDAGRSVRPSRCGASKEQPSNATGMEVRAARSGQDPPLAVCRHAAAIRPSSAADPTLLGRCPCARRPRPCPR